MGTPCEIEDALAAYIAHQRKDCEYLWPRDGDLTAIFHFPRVSLLGVGKSETRHQALLFAHSAIGTDYSMTTPVGDRIDGHTASRHVHMSTNPKLESTSQWASKYMDHAISEHIDVLRVRIDHVYALLTTSVGYSGNGHVRSSAHKENGDM